MKRLANYTAFCMPSQTALRSLVGTWPDVFPCGALLQDAVARALPHGSCPCQGAIDKMTEEVEYADQAEDNQHKFTSYCDLSCHQGHGEIHLL